MNFLGRMVGSCGMLIFSFKDVAKYISKVVAIIYPPQKYMSFLVDPHLCQHLTFSIFFILAILVAINDYK